MFSQKRITRVMQTVDSDVRRVVQLQEGERAQRQSEGGGEVAKEGGKGEEASVIVMGSVGFISFLCLLDVLCVGSRFEAASLWKRARIPHFK